jgi:hypothetical protein
MKKIKNLFHWIRWKFCTHDYELEAGMRLFSSGFWLIADNGYDPSVASIGALQKALKELT